MLALPHSRLPNSWILDLFHHRSHFSMCQTLQPHGEDHLSNVFARLKICQRDRQANRPVLPTSKGYPRARDDRFQPQTVVASCAQTLRYGRQGKIFSKISSLNKKCVPGVPAVSMSRFNHRVLTVSQYQHELASAMANPRPGACSQTLSCRVMVEDCVTNGLRTTFRIIFVDVQ